MDEQLEQYLMQLLEPKQEWMIRLEKVAEEDNIPIMEPLGIEFVRQLLRMHRPKKILEIGTAIGYSSLMMADACPEAKIVTIERDETRYRQALTYIEEQQKQNQIEVIFGDALEMHELIEQFAPFDFLFIDAAKGQYKRFFEMYTSFLKEDGIVVTDNVLFKGLVADRTKEVSKRLNNMVNKIKTFNEWLVSLDSFHTTIMPIGDGVAVSIRKQVNEKGDTKENVG